MNYDAIEEKVRKRLQEELHATLVKGKLLIMDNQTEMEFDFLSFSKNGRSDGRIIGQIKSSAPSRKGKHKGKVRRPTQFGDFCRDIVKLLAAKEGKERWFVLTNKQICSEFLDSKYGKAVKSLGIQIALCPISRSEPVVRY